MKAHDTPNNMRYWGEDPIGSKQWRELKRRKAITTIVIWFWEIISMRPLAMSVLVFLNPPYCYSRLNPKQKRHGDYSRAERMVMARVRSTGTIPFFFLLVTFVFFFWPSIDFFTRFLLLEREWNRFHLYYEFCPLKEKKRSKGSELCRAFGCALTCRYIFQVLSIRLKHQHSS